MRDIACGIQAVHASGFQHLDLKSDNVLVNKKTGAAKLSDFGSCREQRNTQRLTRLEVLKPVFWVVAEPDVTQNTICWAAPELLATPAFISSAADMWSMGCVLLEMVSNALPYAGIDLTRVAAAILANPPLVPPDADPLFVDMMSRCWVRDPKKRCTAAEVVSSFDQVMALIPFLCRF
jgi:serine/threonine protein kinase